jgi:hypothetical protein
MFRVSSEIVPKVGKDNVIFQIDSDHFLSSVVFNPENVKQINNVVCIKTNDGIIVDIENETKELADKNFATLMCIYQYISEDFKLVNIDEKQLGIRINNGITFIVGKLLTIKKDGNLVTVRTTRNEVLVLVHNEKELCDKNFNFIKNYL